MCKLSGINWLSPYERLSTRHGHIHSSAQLCMSVCVTSRVDSNGVIGHLKLAPLNYTIKSRAPFVNTKTRHKMCAHARKPSNKTCWQTHRHTERSNVVSQLTIFCLVQTVSRVLYGIFSHSFAGMFH